MSGDRFHSVWAEDVEPEADPDDLIPGILPRASYVVCAGRRGTGKTFVALDAAFNGASGLPFMGRATAPFGTVYCVGEKRSRFPKRIEAWLQANAGPPPAVRMMWSVPNLLDEEDVGRFIDEVQALKPTFASRGAPLGLVVLDTLARCLRHANVSDADAAGTGIEAIGRIVAECGVSVMPLAHVAKAEGSTSVKGAGEWEDAADAVLRLDRNEQGRTLTIAKQSDDADGAAFPFDLEVVDLGTTRSGKPRTSCVVRHLEGERPAAASRPPSTAQKVLTAYWRLVEAGQTCPAPPPEGVGSAKGVPLSTLQAMANRIGLTSEPEPATENDPDGAARKKWLAARRQAWGRGIKWLTDNNRLRIEDEIVWIFDSPERDAA